MKYTSGEFTFRETHDLKVCASSKFSGTMLEVLLDGKSLFVETGAKKYHLFEIPVEDQTITLFTKLSESGVPSMQLFQNGINMVDESTLDQLMKKEDAACSKESKLLLLRNLILQFLLFFVVAFAVKAISLKNGFPKGDDLTTCLMWGLLLGGGLALLFMLFDIFEGKANRKALKNGFLKPTVLDDDAEPEESDIDPEDIEVPDDAPNFFDQVEEDNDEIEEKDQGK